MVSFIEFGGWVVKLVWCEGPTVLKEIFDESKKGGTMLECLSDRSFGKIFTNEMNRKSKDWRCL